MKTKLFLSLLLSLNFCLLSSQVPQGFNYQAIARDPSNGNNPITGASMQVKIGILSDTIANTMVWEELFNPVKTNAFGMFNIVVGTGIKQSGSAASFSVIDWTKTPLFLRTSIYYPSSWKVMGTSKLESVPYSMVAGNLEGTVPLLSVKGNTTTMDSALFVVRNNTGQIVFAVYNEGVRIYVDDGVAKGGRKGGFAIGSFDKSKGTSQPYFFVDADSIRAYINDTLSKAVKGGFAIGGFDKSKGLSRNYLKVSSDSIRLYTVDTLGHAGFQIKNIKSLSGSSYVNISGSSNISIGEQTGINTTNGFSNTFIGYQSGLNNTSGSANVYLGRAAGKGNVSGVSNIYIGDMCGQNNSWGKGNICMGAGADQNGTGGDFNLILGTGAGSNNNGNGNIFLGFSSGYYNSGQQNVCIGTCSGQAPNSTSSENVFIGRYVNAYYPAGNGNVVIGSYAGQNLSNNAAYNVIIGWGAGILNQGNKNVFLGYNAGYNEIGSNKLYIDNSNTASPLILGDFSARVLTFNGNVGINTNNPAATLQVVNPGSSTIMYIGGSANGQTNIGIGNSGDANGYCFLQSIKAQGTLWGDLVLNEHGGNVGIGTTTPGYRLQVGNAGDGSQARANAWNLLSDIRLKTNFTDINDPLGIVSNLKGFYFNWNTGIDKSRQVGLSAQEVEKVLPEIVSKGDDGYLSVEYSKLAPVLVEAIKVQQHQIANQQQQIESTKQENQQLKSELDELKTLVNTLVANQTGQENK